MSYKYLFNCLLLPNKSINTGLSNYAANVAYLGAFSRLKVRGNCDLLSYNVRHIHTTLSLSNKGVTESESRVPKGLTPDIIATTDIETLKDSMKSNSSVKSPNDQINAKVSSSESIKSVSQLQEVVSVKKLPLWQRIKNELVHYYHGFKLLFLEVKVAFGILNTLTKGKSLTRRERKQLVRTSADLARMVPFLVFIIVPFMEFLLPFYIKFFPFMMPSTFQQDTKENEKTRQILKGKLEIAKFLQETLSESTGANNDPLDGKVNIGTFSRFLKEVRESGLTANTDDILRYSQLFEDEVTLESLEHSQLKALCKMLELNVMGPPTLLRFQLRMRVRNLKVDDQLISSEGIDKIPVWELQQLCRERGMRSIGVSEERLRYQLSQWLSLHLENKVPITLLLLTRIIYLPDTLTAEEKLKQAILVLPKSVSNEAKLKAVTPEERIDNKTKFEVIKEEQKVIKQERIEAKKAAKVTVSDAPGPTETKIEDKAPTIKTSPELSDIAPTIEVPKTTIDDLSVAPIVKLDDVPKDTAPTIKPDITIEDLSAIESAIVNIQKTAIVFPKEELEVLKETREEISKKLPDIVTLEQPVQAKEKAAKRLGAKVDKMITEIRSMVDKLSEEKGDAGASVDETKKPEPMGTEKLAETKAPKTERFISVADLRMSLRKIDKLPDDEKWKQILSILDEDGDGMIEMYHITKMIELLVSENVTLTNTEVTKFLAIVDKEAVIAESRKTDMVKEP